MTLLPAVRPFEGASAVRVELPRPTPDATDEELEFIERLPAMLESDRPAIERELGAPFSTAADGPARWLIGPGHLNAAIAALGLPTAHGPLLHLDRARQLLVSDGPDVDRVVETFAGLRTVSRHPGGPLTVEGCHSLDEAIERIIVEVHDAWPSWCTRAERWTDTCRRHVWRVRGSSDAERAIVAMQRWLAELGDFHTWVRPVDTQLVLPYGACVVDGQVVLTHVLPWTPGWAAGARPGWRLIGPDVRGTWETTPAAPHARPMLVARRLLSGRAGETRHLEARGPGARTARWSETFVPPTGTPASWERLDSGVGYLWIGAWVPDLGVEEVIEEALVELQGAPGLIVDLRGNSGGRLAMATAFRDRFLTHRRQLGWIRSTEPGGRLGAPRAIWGAPSEQRPWTGPVRFLTSPLSYSSTEDCLLGLQGQPGVEVVGEPSGGGSGRLRRLRLLPGWRLTITTSLTWDMSGHCVEGRGIPVDRPVLPDRRNPDGSDPALCVAEHSPW